MPDLHWNDDPEWAGDGKLIHLECGYKLIVDNLMDLTHETFVHGASIGQRSIAEVPFEVTHGTSSATVTRWMRDVEPPPFWKMQLSGSTASRPARSIAGRSSTSRRRARSRSTSASRRPAPARLRATAREGVNGYVLNTMTPETERTCHYFWAFVRNYNLDDSASRPDPRGRHYAAAELAVRTGARADADVEVSEPRSHFELSTGAGIPLIAGGIGITAVGMAHALERHGRPFRVLYAAGRRADAVHGRAVAAARRPARAVRVVEGHRLDLDREIERLHPDGELYLCGPLRLRDAASTRGRPPSAVPTASSSRPLHPAALRAEAFPSAS